MTYVSGSFEVHCISAEPMESGKEFALGTRSLSGRYERQKAVWEETDEAECFFPQFDVSENRTQPRLKRQADLDWSVSNPHTRRRPRDDSGESELFCQLTAADTVRFQVSLGNELPGGRVVRNPQVEPPVARELAPARLRSSRLLCLSKPTTTRSKVLYKARKAVSCGIGAAQPIVPRRPQRRLGFGDSITENAKATG